MTMTDYRAHPLYEELKRAGRECRAARERVLDLWPEGVDPVDLDEAGRDALEKAQAWVVEKDGVWESLRKQIVGA